RGAGGGYAFEAAGDGRRGGGQRASRRCAAPARRTQVIEERMEKFVRFTAKACPLMVPNLNTDQILPARYLKWPRAKGLGTVLFQDLRFDAEGKEQADFPLNQPSYRSARI